jgi:bacterioferritin
MKKALKGEELYGIQLSHEIVKGDLDPQSDQLIDEILAHDEKHVEKLRKLLN